MPKWTPEQNAAINKEGCSIIVSAAAGSGKTTVLTERIVSLVSEGKIDLSRLVAVTFTVAAADNLKKKIYERLCDEASLHPENTVITEQLLKLDEAEISTTDSFCRKLLKLYHNDIGIDDVPKMADEAEIALLKKKCAEKVLEKYIENAEKNEIFDEIYSVFTEARSDGGLTEFITKLFDKVNAYPDREKIIFNAIEKAENAVNDIKNGKCGFNDTDFGKIIVGRLGEIIDYLAEFSAFIKEEIKGLEICEYYGDLLDQMECSGKKWLSYLSKGNISDIRKEAQTMKKKSMPRVRCDDGQTESQKNTYMEIIKNAKNSVFEFIEKNLSYSEENAVLSLEKTVEYEKCIFELLSDFVKVFSAEKAKRRICDFEDLSHFALKILTNVNENGERVISDIGKKIAEETDAVFVDEYQDTNSVQDMIYSFVSNGKNLFAVGDPKQSIYGFRNAEPDIFIGYKDSMPVFPEKPNKKGQTILLSNNFRCSKPIIDFTNEIFRSVMNSSSPDSLYKKGDELVFSKAKEGNENKVEIAVASNQTDGQAEFILNKIKSLTSGEILTDNGLIPKYSDIAIIARKKKPLKEIMDYLREHNIPTSDFADENLVYSEEFLFIDSLLGAIYDPLEDIPLIGAMTSPVFRFTEDELFIIRKFKGGVHYYFCLEEAGKCAQEPLKTKISDFLEKLSFFRNEAKYLSVTDSVFLIYQTLSVREIYSSISDESSYTFDHIIETAEKYDRRADVTLDGFRTFLKNSFSGNDFVQNDDAVRFLTIHKSKGLEFPIVFLVDADGSFSKQEKRKSWLFHKDYGVVTDLLTKSGNVKLKSAECTALDILIEKENREEEKRLLYVALTRAETKLYIVGNNSSKDAPFLKAFLFAEKKMPQRLREHIISSANCHFDMIFAALQGGQDIISMYKFDGVAENEKYRLININYLDKDSGVVFDGFEDENKCLTEIFDFDKINDEVNFEYEDPFLSTLPEKLSVSEILKNDPENQENEISSLFDLSKKSLVSSAAFIGTSMHKAMQFIDFDFAKRDTEKALDALFDRKFITADERRACDASLIENFFRSEIFSSIVKSPRVVREKRFNVLFDAEKLIGKKGQVLVQGVIDIFFENPDGSITVLDFKTDRVRKENGEEILIKRHARQVSLYAAAISLMTGKKVSRKAIYSFYLSKTIDIK